MPPQIEKKLEKFFGRYPQRQYSKGQILIMADDIPSGTFYLQSGLVRVYDISNNGTEVVIHTFKAPTVFPLAWTINRSPNHYFFEAVGKVTTREAPPEKVKDFIRKNPDIMFDLLEDIYVSVEIMRRRMAHLMGGSARNRLIFELVVQAHRFGETQKDGSCLIDLSEAEIGARSGLSRETVSREISRLKKTGLISTARHGMKIKNPEELNYMLGSSL